MSQGAWHADENAPLAGSARRKRRMSDSPWFWVVVFSEVALIGLLLIGPKYLARQERIERMAEGRRRAAENLASAAQTTADASQPRWDAADQVDSPAVDRIRQPSIWPLATVLCMLLMTGLWGLVRHMRPPLPNSTN